MARKARPTGDDATNARKRFYRAAERYLKKAAESTGAAASRFTQLARQNFNDALKTYSKKTTQKFSKPMQALAEKFGVSLSEERKKIKNRSDKAAEEIRRSYIELDKGSKSAKALSGAKLTDEELRQAEARRILNDDAIGSRILGGLIDIWRDEATVTKTFYTETGVPYQKNVIDNSKILPALFKHFDVDNLADLLDKVENIVGDELYANEDSDNMYEAVKLTLQTHVAENNSYTS